MNRYETIFIVTYEINREDTIICAGEFRKILTDAGCKILLEEDWGSWKLRGIRADNPLQEERWASLKQNKGHYWLFEFNAPGSSVARQLDLALERDGRILRFMTVSLDRIE